SPPVLVRAALAHTQCSLARGSRMSPNICRKAQGPVFWGGSKVAIVDTHVHPLSDDRERYPLAPSGDRGPDWHSAMHFTAEECLEQMDLSGVDQMVLVSSFSAYEYDNSYAADGAARYPNRFVGVCRIDGSAPDA